MPAMSSRVGVASIVTRAGAAAASLALLAGCGGSSGEKARLSASTKTPTACAEAVLAALRGVGRRIYHEGVLSERTASARYLIGASHALAAAAERGDPTAAHAAADALIATEHVVSLTVFRRGHLLTSAGASRALAPFSGAVVGTGGAAVGSF